MRRGRGGRLTAISPTTSPSAGLETGCDYRVIDAKPLAVQFSGEPVITLPPSLLTASPDRAASASDVIYLVYSRLPLYIHSPPLLLLSC